MRGAAVVYNNEIHILGGYISGTALAHHYKWDGTSWTDVGSLPYTFRDGSAVVFNDEIHILGGWTSLTSHSKWDGTSWANVSTLPYKFTLGSAVVFNDEIHILGGNSGFNSHYKWDGTSWASVSTIPYQFALGCAVVFNDEMHILGSNRTVTDQVSHYRWNGIEWQKSLNLPYAFFMGAAVVYEDKIFMLGGKDSSSYLLMQWYSCISGDPKPITVPSLASLTPATATAGDIASGKTAWVNGEEVTGTASGGEILVSKTRLGYTTSIAAGSFKNITLSKSIQNCKWLIVCYNDAVSSSAPQIVSTGQYITNNVTSASTVNRSAIMAIIQSDYLIENSSATIRCRFPVTGEISDAILGINYVSNTSLKFTNNSASSIARRIEIYEMS
jgi:hypothetical protein